MRAGAARVKRMIYPVGFRWSVDMKPRVGTDLCMHAHVGFLAHGEIHIEYADGCIVEHKAPQIVAIDPGHDGWVVGDEPVVLIEFDHQKPIGTRHLLDPKTPTIQHIHTVVRTPNGNDYGKDLLRQHYLTHPHPSEP